MSQGYGGFLLLRLGFYVFYFYNLLKISAEVSALIDVSYPMPFIALTYTRMLLSLPKM